LSSSRLDHIALQYGPYLKAIQAVSQCNIGHFVSDLCPFSCSDQAKWYYNILETTLNTCKNAYRKDLKAFPDFLFREK